MKRITLLTFCLAASLLISATSAVSDEVEVSIRSAEQQRDECLLLARHCGTTAYSIQDKIEKLREEIEKGKKAYTIEELNQILPCAVANMAKVGTNRLIWHSPWEIRSKIEQFVASTALLRLQGTLPCHFATAVRQNADVPHPYDQSKISDQLRA